MLERIKEISWDTVAKKFVLRNDRGKKTEVSIHDSRSAGSFIDLQRDTNQAVDASTYFDLGTNRASDGSDPLGVFLYDPNTKLVTVPKGLYGIYWEVDSAAAPGLTTEGFFLSLNLPSDHFPWKTLTEGVGGHLVTQAEAQTGNDAWFGALVVMALDDAVIGISRAFHPSSIPANFSYTQLKITRLA